MSITKKINFIGIIILFSALVFLGVYFLRPRELEKSYIFLSYYYLAHRLTDSFPLEADKIEHLTSYVYENMFQPSVPVKDLPPLDNLIRGVGWCDQMSSLFIRLLEELDMRGYLIFLKDSSGSSPHSIAVVTPSVKQRLNEASLYEQGIVVDNLRGIVVRTKDKRLAVMQDICHNNILEEQAHSLASTVFLYCNKFTVFGTNTPLALKMKKNKFAYRYKLYSLMSQNSTYAFQDFMLQWYFKRRFDKKPDFLLFKARNYHIYGRFDKALWAYEETIKRSSDRKTSAEALFFRGLLYLDMAKIDAALSTFKYLLRIYPDDPWAKIAEDKLKHLDKEKK